MSDYTDEDVQVAMAAGEAIFAAPDDIADEYRAILDAVAPAIVRRAKAEALRDAAFDLENFETFPGEEPMRLRDRADEIEGQS